MTKTIGYNVNYTRAYTEVNCLLDYLPQSYIDKLPKKLIKLIQNQSSEKYNIDIDTNKSLLDQNFSKKTKDLIAVIKYNYWSTDEERKRLKEIFYDNENKYQKELREKYNPDNIFKNKQEQIEVENIEKHSENLPAEIKKETFFEKLINYIKGLFKKTN